MKPFYLFFCFLMLSVITFGQVINPQYLKLPGFAPTSPDVASIQKSANIPATPSTGASSIDVPVWTISCGPISWPISISYNTSGIRVDEISSSIGLGFALLGQGVISRTVMGKPDEETVGEPGYDTLTWSSWNYLYGVLNGTGDSEYDVYTYNFRGRTGQFYIRQNGQIFSAPYTTMKITPITGGFTIVDEEGITYTFDKKETAQPVISGAPSYTSAWYMTKVETADKKQSILFNYVYDGYIDQTTTVFTQGLGSRPSANACTGGASIYSSTPDVQSITTSTTVCRLSSITFPNGSLNFSYVSGRADIVGTGTFRLTKIEVKQAATGLVLRSFSLAQSYFASGNRLRLNGILESQAGNGGPNKPYTFEYIATNLAPVGSYAQDAWGFNNAKTANTGLLKAQVINFGGTNYNIGNADRSVDTTASKAGILTAVNWPTGGRSEYTYDVHQFYPGYLATTSTEYSAVANQTTQTATTTFTFPATTVTNSTAIIDISPYNNAVVTGIPYVQIKNLTTGLIVFSMENNAAVNTLHSEQSISLVPGNNYEIKSFVFSSSSSIPFTTSIKIRWSNYASAPTIQKGGGLRLRMVKRFTEPGNLAGTDFYQYDPGVTLSAYHLININKKTLNFRTGNSGCTVISPACDIYYSSSIYPLTAVAGPVVMYNKVTKYQLDASNVDKGKVEYEFNVLRDNISYEGLGYSFAYFNRNEWKNGALLRETNFKRTGSGVNDFAPVLKSENQYNEIKIDDIDNLQIKTKVIDLTTNAVSAANATTDMDKYTVPIYSGVNKLFRTIQTAYDDNGGVLVSETDNQFNASSHDFITKTIRTDSRGVSIASEFKYPVDFSVTGNVYSKMVAKNIISPAIESKQFKEVTTGMTTTQTLLTTVKNDYRDWKNDSLVLAPEFIKASLNSDPLVNKVVYTNYNDRKQPVEVNKEQDASNCVIYGYNYSVPIAEITNATEAGVAYTSFEGDNGGWTISGTQVSDASAPTGKKAFLFSSTISKTGVPTANSYFVSYWKKSGTVTISGSTVRTGRTVNGWTFYEHKINAPAPSTISVTGSAATIDELRLYPATNSLMTTYTYEPLVGVTSTCDPNNRISSYEYDELQRVILTRDQDQNILNKSVNQLDGQPAFDNIYYNVVKSGSFQKTGCSGCNMGTTVAYSVAANTYSSTVSQAQADSLAQVEVNNNGQAYANANGSCVTPTQTSLTSTISIGMALTYTFTNTCTGTVYVRSRPGDETDEPLSTIPQGTYNVKFEAATPGTYFFYQIVAAQSSSGLRISPFTISNIAISGTGAQITVTP